MNTPSYDRIEKKIVLRAPRSRVWRAITDSEEFGSWFLVKLEGAFVVGEPVRGQITYPGCDHMVFEAIVERMEAERVFSYRWHPASDGTGGDEPKGPSTLVEFRLKEVEEGTQLTLVESGFGQIPEERRLELFRRNEEGWTAQMENIRRHVEGE